MEVDDTPQNNATDIFLERLRMLVNVSSDGKLTVINAIGCLEIVKQELYKQWADEGMNPYP